MQKTETSKNSSIIDTSNMSAGERAALEMAEDSRDQRVLSGFASALFMGDPNFSKILPFPKQKIEDQDQGNAFLQKFTKFLDEKVDPDEIDASGEIPEEVFQGLAELKAFAIKVPTKYGGLGLSQTNYSRAVMELGKRCGNLTALLSAHQSIGIPQPLIVFGTEAQKQKYLSEIAKGAVSAFALTEHEVGSDPARMKTTAELSEDGKEWVINGEKLWCTNGTKARYIVVMAKTPMEGRRNATTAFIVDSQQPGVDVVTRCRFMGLKALYNGVIRFTDVRVPRENVIHEEGKGLKVALTTLNTGRLSLPAACAGMMKEALRISLDWCARREQWGQAIGKHAAIAGKIADISANAFATEAMVMYVSALVDNDKKADIRIEAAMAKLWGTEAACDSINETMQLKGGRGYETAQSLKARGEVADPIERMYRDVRINTIFEGSTEIMKLFIAREALDPHLRAGAAAIDTRKSVGERFQGLVKAGFFYAGWYPSRYLPQANHIPSDMHPFLKRQSKRIAGLSKKLSRELFHAMVLFGPSLDKQQLLLGRLVDIATELFAMSASVGRTQQILNEECDADITSAHAMEITKYICRRGRRRINNWFDNLHRSPDSTGYKLAGKLLDEA